MNIVYEEIENLRLMPNAIDCIRILRKNNIKTVILTGIFDVLAERFHRKLGTDYLLCNKLIIKDNMLYDIQKPILGAKEKADFFENLAKRLGIKKEECVAVGDGANDVEYFKKAGFRIGFNPQPILKEYADVVVDDLMEVSNICLKIKNISNQLNHSVSKGGLIFTKPQKFHLRTFVGEYKNGNKNK